MTGSAARKEVSTAIVAWKEVSTAIVAWKEVSTDVVAFSAVWLVALISTGCHASNTCSHGQRHRRKTGDIMPLAAG
jgi:hypothetical protein